MSGAAIALTCAVLAAYVASVAAVYARSTTHFRKATSFYIAYRPADGDAEMEHGRKLRRRAEKMIPFGPRGGAAT